MAEADISKRSYHHGDLRAALIDAGLRLLAERREGEVGLREVARAVGVSATAVYRHFPDKDALRAALAREGFDRLGEVQKAAGEAAGGGIEGFNATGRAYVRFALANPALFRLMASTPEAMPSVRRAEQSKAMTLLRENAARLVARGGDEAARLFAIRAWSLVHGLAMLLLDGQVRLDDAGIDAAVDARGFMAAAGVRVSD